MWVAILVNPFSAGINISHLNLTSIVDPRSEIIKKIILTVDTQHSIHMKWKEITKSFLVISN